MVAGIQKALADSGFLDAVKVAGDLANGIAHGQVPAVDDLGLGASIGFNARLKTSLPLLALGNTNYNEPHGTLLAGFDLPITMSASAGVALGEGVEFTAEGGVTAGMSLANLTLRQWGEGLPVRVILDSKQGLKSRTQVPALLLRHVSSSEQLM